MISPKLQAEFRMEETLIFPIWQKSSAKKKEEICKKLGEAQGKAIIKEIEEKANEEFKNLQK